eukprot:TRINITY_DN22880_c0_g1_i1.p1 TRINITY_DN22880_c0_g1~~TRINITY_DN22880_c0_g1_i1.p1  ORF type:complete len:575 (+),score=50.10 TRINITY_DN22880_c0_g1_i1:156-1880(+)
MASALVIASIDGKESRKSGFKQEKEKGRKNVEQRSGLGIRGPLISKKNVPHTLTVKSEAKVSFAAVASDNDGPRDEVASLEAGCSGEHQCTGTSSVREDAIDGHATVASGESGLDDCDVSSWPDFSLDSLDAGEIDDLDMSGSLVFPELEDQSQVEPDASIDTRPSETSKNAHQSEQYETSSKSGSKSTSGKKKAKVDWTPELHRRFVQAVEQLGVEKAIPSRILELMGVKSLTRHNIASHLQKYRSHRRHLAAREAEAANWNNRKPADGVAWPGKPAAGAVSWQYPGSVSTAQAHPPTIQPRPVVGVPQTSFQYPHIAQPSAPAYGMPMHVWGHPTMDHSRTHMWQQPQQQAPAYPPPAWFAPDGSVWHYGGMQAPFTSVDAWGQPTMGVPGASCFPHHQGTQQQHIVPAVSYPMGPSVVCGAPVCGPGGVAHEAVAGVPSVGIPAQVSAMHSQQVSGVSPEASEAIADEAMPSPMFPLSDDLTLDFAAISNCLTDDLSDANDILDAAITEALSNPTAPLPLGLKPPSVDGVLEELNKQGITMPPPACLESPDAIPEAEVADVVSDLEAVLEH